MDWLKRKNKIAAGFTLIEVIAVLFVISLGLLGVLSLIIQNIQSQSINKNTLIAYQLAQEGIELIRKTRDTQWNAGLAWDAYFPGLSSNADYFMSYSDSAPSEVEAEDDKILHYDAFGFYNHTEGADDSGFRRVINLARIDENSLRVAVTVTWSDYARDRSYSLETILYDWQ